MRFTGWRPHRPRTRRGRTLAAGGTVLVAVSAGAGLFVLVAGTSSPAPLSLGSSASGAVTTTSRNSSTTASAPASGGGTLAGTWTIADDSVAGYRVCKQLAFLSARSDAVGRTSSIKGSMTVGGSSPSAAVAAASFTVDVTALASDRPMRDERIRTMGIESDRYPTATFVLTLPITLPANATSGPAFRVSAPGRLTIHGVARTETIAMVARIGAGHIEVAGSITFPWSDFGMTAPSVGGFVSVTDRATMEFDLVLRHGYLPTTA